MLSRSCAFIARRRSIITTFAENDKRTCLRYAQEGLSRAAPSITRPTKLTLRLLVIGLQISSSVLLSSYRRQLNWTGGLMATSPACRWHFEDMSRLTERCRLNVSETAASFSSGLILRRANRRSISVLTPHQLGVFH